MERWWPPSALIDAVFAGADEDEGGEDEGEFEGVGGFAETVSAVLAQGGDAHGEDEQQAGGAEGEADDEEADADGLGEGGHEAPEAGPEGDADVFHRAADRFPFGEAASEFGEAVDVDEERSEDEAEEEERDVFVVGKVRQHAGGTVVGRCGVASLKGGVTGGM